MAMIAAAISHFFTFTNEPTGCFNLLKSYLVAFVLGMLIILVASIMMMFVKS